MKLSLPTTGAMLFLGGGGFVHAVNPGAESSWAQFCDDTACSVNCGTSVDLGNAGCLAHEGGRKSFKLHGSNFIGAYLVHSPGEECDCQNDCTEISGTGAPSCVDISGSAPSKSYRFQLTTCKETEGGSGVGNNCPPPPDN
ncbi:uncharacterized protein F4822DRAFT_431619 [Hypoxylon trugodes]|uniref:uncharacterized protein n=1 Tax=Hypoxylon trugodes TaxID=326681 RepID=UPI00219D3B21|nr:uncharacterized protein F4822DRAFT_431619 [Hypoxylon trugodes]KAI1386751.1 hypothetical protein F4822DRAFT_431619 [Hypoxylon trugodes]